MRGLGISNARSIHRSPRFHVFRGAWDGAPVVAKQAVTPEAAEALRREYEMLHRVEGPGVAKALALDERSGNPMLVLEDAGPEDLSALIARGPLSVETFLHIAVALAETLARVHAASIVHRDICPENVVLRHPHEPTLVDFDLATDAVTVVPLTPPEALQGTLATMSPEQTGRLNRVVDARSDLYSLGATLYGMLTGALPFAQTSAAAVVRAHLIRTPVSASAIIPQVPPTLARIVDRLLEKAPEDRYQSADALAEDLRTARTQWYAHRSIEPFELGLLDRRRVLTLPDSLYGRDVELGAVREVMKRVRAGAREVVTIIGEPGTGKSALLDAIAANVGAPVLRAQFGAPGGAPYAPLLSAFGARLEAIAADPLGSSALRRRITEALGPNAAALAELLPELRAVLGSMPAVARARPPEDALRFRFTFVALARALARPEAPLVLVLDDVQWADSASVDMLRALATDSEAAHLLLVTACRPGCRTFQAPGATATTLILGPLSFDDVTAFVADALSTDRARARPLAEIVYRHSAGVPLLVRSVLSSFYQMRLLVYDERRSAWRWDLKRIASLPLPARAVDVLIRVIERLPPATRDALAVAACIGRSFELALLAAVRNESVDACAGHLWAAVREGVIRPAELERASSPAYRFAHDRVQQAAYELVPEAERSAIHLRIGRALLASRCDDEALFEIVEQLERGADRIDSDEQAIALAALELSAGRRARASVAYGPALGFFERGIAHLPKNAWRTHHDLAFDLHRDAIECCYVTGDPARLDAIASRAEAESLTALERAELSRLRVSSLTQDGRFEEAVAHGREALARLGVELPERVDDAELRAEIERVRVKLASRGREALIDWPRAEDPFVCARSTLLGQVATPLYFIDPDLSTLADVMILPMALEHGTTPEAPTSLLAIARYLVAVQGDWAQAERIARVALEAARRSDDRARESETLANVAIFVQPWHAPVRSCVPLLRRAYELGAASGGMTFAAYARTSEVIARFAACEPLCAVEVEADAARELGHRVGNPIGELPALLLARAVRRLRAAAPSPDPLDPETLRLIERNPIPAHYRQLLELEMAVIFGRFDDARRYAEACDRFVPFVRGMVAHVHSCFFGALARAASPSGAEELGDIRRHHAAIARWARGSPESFAFMERALGAEIARLEGRDVAAFDQYDRAIELASEQRATLFEALVCERAAAHHRSRERDRAASLYLASARDAYARWGATAKVQQLEAQLPTFIGATPAREARIRSAAAFELTAVQRAADEIISALEWDPLLERILSATRDLAGATRAALVLVEDGRLAVRGVLDEAELRATPMRATLGGGIPLATTVVEQAFRSGETALVIDARDASTDDPYLESHDVRSVLAIPVQHYAVRTGVLYLEHRISPRAFDAQQIAALELLAAHVTTALENWSLFDKLRHEIEERRRTEERVRFLLDASTALAESLDLQTTLGRVARLSVARITEYCAIDLYEEGGVCRIAEACAHELGSGLAEIPRMFEPSSASPIAIARRGQAVLVPALSSTDLALFSTDAEHLAHLRELGLRTLVSVPITARGQVLGAMSLASARRRVRYGSIDIRLAEELAARVALAVENARLYLAAREAVRVRDEFLSVASHELRGPVSALQLTLQGLTSGLLPQLPSEASRPLAIAERQGQRLAKLINELLDVSRLRAKKLYLHLEPIALSELVADIAERFEGELAKAECTLEVFVPPGIVGRWDPSRLGQVIENLLSNAIKFGRGKPIEIRAECSDKTARLVIRDHGVGIPTERIPYIFDRFERAVSPEHFGGLGLGLYIVREIVGALDGRVQVESVEGEGASFTVELPLGGPAHATVEETHGRSA